MQNNVDSYFIKFDVQRYDVQVIGGMAAILVLPKPMTILAEFWPYGLESSGSSAKCLFNEMMRYGFRANLLKEESGVKPASLDEIISSLGSFGSSEPNQSFTNVVFQR